MNMHKNHWFGGLAAGLMLGCAMAWAQDDASAEADTAASGPVIKSLNSEVLPKTSQSLLLDIANTGARVIAVGDRGAVIASSNGKQWAQVQTPTRSALTAVHFPDADNGWAVGHDAVILHTADGGRTWALQHFAPELEKPLLDVLFLDSSRGFAVGAYGLMYTTEDGGQTWSEADSPIRESELHFNSIARLNDGALFIAGEQGTLAVSADAGLTWATVQSPYDSSLFGAAPHGDKGVVIFGLRGNVFVADDAQKPEWRQLETGSVASMFGATQTEDGRLVMVGLNGNIMVSANGLDRVELLKSKAGTPLSAAIPFGDQILAVGESGVQPIALQ